MRTKLVIFILLATLNLFILNTVDAIGGGGGAAGGGGFGGGGRGAGGAGVRGAGSGGARGGHVGGRTSSARQDRGVQSSRTIQRSPSMSRTRSNQRNNATRTVNPTQRTKSQAATRNQVNQFIKNNPSVNLQNNNIRQTATQTATETATRAKNVVNRAKDNPNFDRVAGDVRSNINNNYPNRNNWFDNNFNQNHNYQPSYNNLRGNLWRGAAASEINQWLNYRNQPYYYYGYDGDWTPSVYDSAIYVESNESESQIAENSQNQTTDSQWISLGVFSISKNTESLTTPNMFLQLALSKNGDIAGTFYNTTTNKVYEVTGGIESQSQRAFWKVADNPESPFVETGLYNLTQNVAPIRVYFQNGEVKDLLLVRVES